MASKIFLSHAAADQPLAEYLASEIQKRDSTVSVFVASRPGDIRPDQEWPSAIQAELRRAGAYIVLLIRDITKHIATVYELLTACPSPQAPLALLTNVLSKS